MQGVARVDRIENKYARGSLGVTETSKKIAGRRLTWAGHRWRRTLTPNDRSVAKVMEMELPGARQRGDQGRGGKMWWRKT